LVAAAENVHLVWIEDAERQRSRFVEQIIWEKEKKDGQIGGMPVSRVSLPVILITPPSTDNRIKKDETVMAKLKNQHFSPTWIDAYLNCRLRFYYEKILGLTPPGEVAEGMEADELGVIIHDIMRRTLEPFKGMALSAERAIEVRQRLALSMGECLGGKDKSGEHYMFRRLVEIRLNDYFDRILLPHKTFTVLELESSLKGSFSTGKNTILLKGIMDRLDVVEGIKTVIDYKTGMVKPEDRIDYNADLGDIETVRKHIHSFQLPIYAHMLMQSGQGISAESVDARLVYLQDEKEASVFRLGKKKRPGTPKMIMNEFYLKGLATLVDEMLNPEQDFQPYKEQDCEECPFRGVCGLN
jgi:ATP-dependent helicase/nuclease subunit B